MFPWRVSIAVFLGLAWCFSDCVRAVAQYFLCFLFCFSATLLLASSSRDGSTQTDEETKEAPLQVIKPFGHENTFSPPNTQSFGAGRIYTVFSMFVSR